MHNAYVHIYTHVCICMYACMYMYMYVHTFRCIRASIALISHDLLYVLVLFEYAQQNAGRYEL